MNNFLRQIAVLVFFSTVFIKPSQVYADKYFNDNHAFFLEHLKKQKYAIDTSATAIILYEYQSYDLYSSLYLKHNVRRIIKVIKKSGSEYADINIPLPGSRYGYYHINKVHGVTYNLENGKMVKQEINEENVTYEVSQLVKEKKINMPAVHEGSIIDYTFEIEEEKPFFYIAKWQVQEEIPKLYCKAEIFAPKLLNIVAFDQIIPAFINIDENKKDLVDSTLPYAYSDREVRSDVLATEYWVRRNLHAFEDEPYLSDKSNYMECMQFYTKSVHFNIDYGILNSWDKINYSLLESFAFYKAFTEPGGAIKQITKEITGEDTSEIKIAKKIFRYVRDSITWNGYTSLLANKPLSKVFKEKSGSSAEVNLLLIAMLRNAGLSCSPIILVTKGNGIPSTKHPDIYKYNYTICQLRVNGQKYYLDASGRYNPFGVLPAYCLNGYARVIDKKDTCAVMFGPNMAKDRALFSVKTIDNSLKNYTLNFKLSFGEQIAMEYRKKWNDDTTGIRKYLIGYAKNSSVAVKLKDYKIQNLNNPDAPLMLDFNLTIAWAESDSLIYFNPYMVRFFEETPFPNSKRNYPVEFPYTRNITYACYIQLPQGYIIDEVPKSTTVKIDDENFYKSGIEYDKENNSFNINSGIQLQRSDYSRDDYDMLRDFFEKVIEQQQINVAMRKQS